MILNIPLHISINTVEPKSSAGDVLYLLEMRYADRESELSWWRHQMETFAALLAICAGNSPITGELPAQTPVTRSFDAFFDLCLNQRLSKQSRRWWFETPSPPLWRHRNVICTRFCWRLLCFSCVMTHWKYIFEYSKIIQGSMLGRVPHCQWRNLKGYE